MNDIINVALPKGRLGEKVYDMFEAAGFPCPSIKEDSRKLIFESEEAGVRYFWVKPSDVAIYVERGAADIGVAGRDITIRSCRRSDTTMKKSKSHRLVRKKAIAERNAAVAKIA